METILLNAKSRISSTIIYSYSVDHSSISFTSTNFLSMVECDSFPLHNAAEWMILCRLSLETIFLFAPSQFPLTFSKNRAHLILLNSNMWVQDEKSMVIRSLFLVANPAITNAKTPL
uniref:Uncharacterized protein n=1 Tax=Oryza brachyantha TaxID=4533 RepID=J3M146_ORYBR